MHLLLCSPHSERFLSISSHSGLFTLIQSDSYPSPIHLSTIVYSRTECIYRIGMDRNLTDWGWTEQHVTERIRTHSCFVLYWAKFLGVLVRSVHCALLNLVQLYSLAPGTYRFARWRISSCSTSQLPAPVISGSAILPVSSNLVEKVEAGKLIEIGAPGAKLGFWRDIRIQTDTTNSQPSCMWSNKDSIEWSLAFTSQAKDSRCKYCFSLFHQSIDCEFTPSSNPRLLMICLLTMEWAKYSRRVLPK